MLLQETLEKLGLDGKEIATYLAALELSECTIVPLVKKTGIVRTTLVYVLEKLQTKGLIEIVQHATHKRYIAVSPKSLISLIRKKGAQLEMQAQQLEEVLPELNQLFRSSPFQPRVQVFKGEELRDLYNDIIDQPINEMCYVGNTTNISLAVGDRFLRDWIRRRAAKQIKARAIRIRSGEQETDEYVGTKELLRTIRYAPEGFTSPSVILIYGDSVAVVTTAKESFGVVTTSRDYAESMRSWFKELWKISSEQ